MASPSTTSWSTESIAPQSTHSAAGVLVGIPHRSVTRARSGVMRCPTTPWRRGCAVGRGLVTCTGPSSEAGTGSCQRTAAET
ncbi:hypothetical protein DEJ02_15690 [Curtobacterium sp. MCLR17_042]|nr:hypothetical protein DEJ02_15690 [Curtobacterium sp. MCLR17_042]